MSAPSPALVPAKRQAVKVRLGDPAAAAGYLSVIFALLLLFFPVSFPSFIVHNWRNGHLTMALAIFAVLFNSSLYLLVSHIRSATVYPFSWVCIALGTLVVSIAFSFVVPSAVLFAHWRSPARVNEEVVALTYFALVAAVFLPYLLIRATQERNKSVS